MKVQRDVLKAFSRIYCVVMKRKHLLWRVVLFGGELPSRFFTALVLTPHSHRFITDGDNMSLQSFL